MQINTSTSNSASLTPRNTILKFDPQLEKLKTADAQVRAHEAAHLAAGGGVVSGGASFSYEREGVMAKCTPSLVKYLNVAKESSAYRMPYKHSIFKFIYWLT